MHLSWGLPWVDPLQKTTVSELGEKCWFLWYEKLEMIGIWWDWNILKPSTEKGHRAESIWLFWLCKPWLKKKQSLRMAHQTYYCRYLAKDVFFADSTQNSSTDFDPPWNFLENRNRSSQTEELLRPWLVVFQCVFKKPPRDSCEIYSGHYSSL